MRMVLTAFLFIIGFIANAATCDGGDAAADCGGGRRIVRGVLIERGILREIR